MTEPAFFAHGLSVSLIADLSTEVSQTGRKWKPTGAKDGAPGRNRTCGARIRNPLLYPLSYGGV